MGTMDDFKEQHIYITVNMFKALPERVLSPQQTRREALYCGDEEELVYLKI